MKYKFESCFFKSIVHKLVVEFGRGLPVTKNEKVKLVPDRIELIKLDVGGVQWTIAETLANLGNSGTSSWRHLLCVLFGCAKGAWSKASITHFNSWVLNIAVCCYLWEYLVVFFFKKQQHICVIQ